MARADGPVPQIEAQVLLPIARQAIVTRGLDSKGLDTGETSESPADRYLLDAWQMVPIQASADRVNTWRLSGTLHGPDGPRAFSVILKRLRGIPEQHPEVQAYRSGMLDRLREQSFGLIAARCFGVSGPAVSSEPSVSMEATMWLWLEDMAEPPGTHWSLGRYGLAAYHLGRFNGAYPVGLARSFFDDPGRALEVPTHPWLGNGFLADWLGFVEQEGLGDAILGTRPEDERAWEHPLVRRVYPAPLRARLIRLWRERLTLLAALNRLPRTLAHGDAHRRNLLTRVGAAGELTVGVDWDAMGLAPLGEDPGHLVSSSQIMGADPRRARELDRIIFERYLQGLRDAGWRLDQRTRDLIRFGYALHTSLNMGVFVGGALPAALSQPWLRQWIESLFHRPLETAAPLLALLTDFTLDLADEAREQGAALGVLL
ncbi:MAG: aminoglycoside phosphotransferase family protein [Chloroflexota bacterium]|nr:aminoglycoside phosphotransferase family protein [Chloroflexota bacterium]